MKSLRVLVACEVSGTVRDAFLALGHEAISCDLKPTQSPGPHHQGDVREILGQPWDLLVAHPVCRYLTNSGVRWLGTEEGRWEKMGQACEFFLLFENANHIPRRVVENPIMHGHALRRIGRRADQFIQPWMFGDPFKKATGLWLTGLPLLKGFRSLASYAEPPRQECWLMGPSEEREEKRSKTYPGIARALAWQYGGPTSAPEAVPSRRFKKALRASPAQGLAG